MKRRTGCLIIIVIVIISLLFYITKAMSKDFDPYYKEQWALNDGNGINVEKIWNREKPGTNDKDIVIAIIDTGVDFSNIELDGLQWTNISEISNNGIDDDNNGYIDDVNGYSFFDTDNDSIIPSYHGTICSEIIGAKHNNKGIEGVVGKSIKVQFMDIKVSSSNNYWERGSVNDIIAAVKYADMMGADICNMSFSSEYDFPGLKEIMSSSDMLFVVSAGNNISGWKTNIDKRKIYPAEYSLPNIITVTNLNKEGEVDKSAAYGKNKVDIAAPGTEIVALDSNGRKEYYTGTSFAVAHVTGLAAILKAYDPSLSAVEIKQILCTSARQTKEIENKCKYGVLNANRISIGRRKET